MLLIWLLSMNLLILILIMVLRMNLKPFERNYKLLVLIWNIVL